MPRAPHRTLARWLERVADGLDAGFEAASAVDFAKELPGGRAAAIRSSLQEGRSWVESFAGADLLEPAELAIVDAAESSGSLPQALRSLATAREDRALARGKLLLASLYPLFLAHFAAFAFAAPRLVDGSAAAFLVSAGMTIVPLWSAIGLLALAARVWPRFPRSAMRVLPLFRSYRKNWDASVLCRSLAVGFKAGMATDRAWEVGLAGADSPEIDRMGEQARAAIGRGAPASEGIAAARAAMPDTFLQAYVGGERSGNLVEALERLAALYAKDARARLQVATLVYPKILLVPVVGYVGYRVVMYFKDYYESILNIAG